jgi:glycerol-3-phosphate dehydrogenase (NAD(P)+)
MTPRLRVYSQTDVLGVELCGALKNIIAIGAGVSDGKGYGDNAKAAFVTRGLAEMTRLGTAAGANPLTFAGLAGIGDLWATCASNYSRNRWVGTELARGRPVAEILDDMHHVAEGVPTTQAAKSMGERLGVETPIIDQAFRVLFEGLDVETALVELMVRDAKHELEGLLLV